MKLQTLEKDCYYHIYNRGINSTPIFTSEDNKEYFLRLIDKYLSEKVGVLAYCLIDSHYHLAVKILSDEKSASQALSNLLNSYTKAFNKRNYRTGSLFEKHFKRIKVKDENYLRNLIVYIHKNPQLHSVTKDFRSFKFSSYILYASEKGIGDPIITLNKEEVLPLFDDIANFIHIHYHKLDLDLEDLEKIVTHKRVDLQGLGNLVGAGNLAGVEKKTNASATMKDQFYSYIKNLQNTICAQLEEVDGLAKFREDLWERPEGGGGRTRVIENGGVFEKGGVNISAVHGALPQSMQAYFGVKDADFFACGLSLVIHPKNPMVPTVHANWRYFEMYDKEGNTVDQWFGGGQDLTPYYLFDEDAIHFHSVCKQACDVHHSEFYTQYKKKCDDYFWNAHRNEARGIGGLFFDYCKPTKEMSLTDWYNFVAEVGNSFLQSYIPIVINRKDLNFNSNHSTWQEIRRGRYVEFNLVHDKGTLFGLKTNGRIESILMSLPPHVQWVYDHHPEPGSEEERLVQVLRNPKDWIL